MNCTIAGCDRRAHGHGWCPKHYHRWRRYGDPLREGNRLGQSVPLEPLWVLVRPENQGELAERVGVTRRTVVRWRAQGVPVIHADRVAARVGFHALTVWPECEI